MLPEFVTDQRLTVLSVATSGPERSRTTSTDSADPTATLVTAVDADAVRQRLLDGCAP